MITTNGHFTLVNISTKPRIARQGARADFGAEKLGTYGEEWFTKKLTSVEERRCPKPPTPKCCPGSCSTLGVGFERFAGSTVQSAIDGLRFSAMAAERFSEKCRFRGLRAEGVCVKDPVFCAVFAETAVLAHQFQASTFVCLSSPTIVEHFVLCGAKACD